WDTPSPNWIGGSPNPSLYKNGDIVNFAATATDSIISVLAAGVTPGALNISNNSNRYTFVNGAIGGSTSLVKTNAGAMILASPNTYSGGTVISGGTLETHVNSAFGTGTVVLDGATWLTTTSPQTLTGPLVVMGAAPTITTIATLTLNGPMWGLSSSPLVKDGGGKLVLTGPNSLPPVNILAGTVELQDPLGLGTNQITLSDATLQYSTVDQTTRYLF